jgi:hypothetical protein
MAMFDDSMCSNIIDGLLNICNRLGDESIDTHVFELNELENRVVTKQANELKNKMKADTCSKQDLADGTLSAVWVTVMEILIESGFEFSGDEDYDDYAHRLPPHQQRAMGALLCACEFMLHSDIKYAPLIRQSLSNIFHGNDDNIYGLFVNYRSLFSYSYMFLRRIGKFNKVSTDTLENIFKSKPTTSHTSRSSVDDEVLYRSTTAANIIDLSTSVDDVESDSIIDVMDSVEEFSLPTAAAASLKTTEAAKPTRSALVRRKSADPEPVRTTSRSVSFSTEAPEVSAGMSGLIASISKISNQNLSALDTENKGASVETTSSSSSCSHPGLGLELEVEDMEDDNDDDDADYFFISPEKPKAAPLSLTARVVSVKASSSQLAESEPEAVSPIKRDDIIASASASHLDSGQVGKENQLPLVQSKEETTAVIEPLKPSFKEQLIVEVPPKLPAAVEPVMMEARRDSSRTSQPTLGTTAGSAPANETPTKDILQQLPEPTLPKLHPLVRDPSVDTIAPADPPRASFNSLRVAPPTSPTGSSVPHLEESHSPEGRPYILPKRADSFNADVDPSHARQRLLRPATFEKVASSLSRSSRPPLPAGSHSSGALLASVAMDKSIVVPTREVTDFASMTNATMEGWLEKKSATTGFWLKVRRRLTD